MFEVEVKVIISIRARVDEQRFELYFQFMASLCLYNELVNGIKHTSRAV